MWTNILIGIQVVLCLILIVVVLMQEGNQKGLSGSIGGGAETFFGKNNSRTLNAKLKKSTAIIAILFLLSSIALGFVMDAEKKADDGVELPVAPVTETAPEADKKEDAETDVAPEGDAATTDATTPTPDAEAPAAQ